jgi:CubicO group peptidase (beta-lactamase class C family)
LLDCLATLRNEFWTTLCKVETIMSSTSADLSNWRRAPHSAWAFINVDSLVQTEVISCAHDMLLLAKGKELNLETIQLADGLNCLELIEASDTDGFIVLQDGKIVSEYYSHAMSADTRHIVFSVSKSITGIVAGILIDKGTLDPQALASAYVPELALSAYADATVRDVLDMQVDVRFVEDYLDPAGDVARYRVAMDWDPPVNFRYEGGLHNFLSKLPKASRGHGSRFNYASPTTDVLGWIMERASGEKISRLLSTCLWSKIGAEHDGFVTVDRHGAARTAGGICTTLRDLARIGELVRNNGKVGKNQIVSQSWLHDMRTNGSRSAWQGGDMTGLFPYGAYRSKWYIPNQIPGELVAIGIHGQWIYVDPGADLTIAKLSSQPLPVDDALDLRLIEMFRAIGAHFKSKEQP